MLHHSVVALVPVGYAMPSFLLYAPRPTLVGGGGSRGILRVSSTGMIKWGQKPKPQNILRPFSKTPKISRPNIDPQKTLCRISETPKRRRYHESSDYYYYPPKIPESKISNPKKSFDHPHHLKSGNSPPPPPPPPRAFPKFLEISWKVSRNFSKSWSKKVKSFFL